MTVQRFNPVASAAISLSEQGEYVKYEDYEKLAAKLSIIKDLMEAAGQANKLAQEATEKLVQERDALAAENAGLKKAVTEFNELYGLGLSVAKGIEHFAAAPQQEVE